MNYSQFTLLPRPPFHFGHSAYSHGWVVLAPTEWDESRNSVRRVQLTNAGDVVLLDIGGDGDTSRPRIDVSVAHAAPLTSEAQAGLERAVAHMFRLDEDLSDFYARCQAKGGSWLHVTDGRGRLLRSPTLFEDVVKTIATTNTQWGGTKRMVAALVEALGEPFPGDTTRRAFPTPEAIAAADPDSLVAARWGYRAPYVHTLAHRVASGSFDLEGLGQSDLPTSELKKELLQIKGVGPYAAATLLMLIGRYDEIGVDTVFRDFVSRKYFDGTRPADREMLAVYDEWGPWKYLAYWSDLWQGLEEAL